MKPLGKNKGKNIKENNMKWRDCKKAYPKGFKVYEEAKVNRLTALASSLNTTVRDFVPQDEILAALGAPPVEPQMCQEQQASILKLKKKYLDNNHLDTKCYQCPQDRPPFPSWSALEDHYNTRHLKDPKHKYDYEGCNKVFSNRQSLKKYQKLHHVRERVEFSNALLKQPAISNAQNKLS